MFQGVNYIIALIAVALVQNVGPSSNPTPADARAIAELVLADEARIHSDPEYGSTCVRLETTVAFAQDRRELETQARNIAQSTRPEQQEMEERQAQLRQYGWSRPGETGRGSAQAGPFDPAEARSLSESVDRIVHAEARPSLLEQLDPASLQPPLRPCRDARSRPFLELSSPAFDGEVAFVETAYVCGGLCGNGLLYALRRNRGDWHIVAVSDTWIS